MKRELYSGRVNGGGEGAAALSASAAVAHGVRQGEPLPTMMRVLKWGDNRTVDGGVKRVNEVTAALLPDMQRQLNWPHAHIDIEHATLPGTALFEQAAREGKFAAVLGWGEPVVIAGEGLFVRGITWTPESGRAYEFPDVSGVVKSLPDGTVTALHSLAFCCHGKAEGAVAFSALVDEVKPEEETMDKVLLALLGLDETADEAALVERASRLGAALQALAAGGESEVTAMSALLKLGPAKLTALGALDTAKLAELSKLGAADLGAKLTALSQMDEGAASALTALVKRVGTAEERLTALSQSSVAGRRAALLEKAAASGKAVPEAWLGKYGENLDALSDMIDALPADVVPLSQRTVPGARPVTAAGKEESAVARIFGHDPKDLPKA